MTARGSYLILVFLPFLVMGPLLLLLAQVMQPRAGAHAAGESPEPFSRTLDTG